MAAPKVLLVVAHPVIASGIETLLKLEGDYDIKRVASVSDATKQREWAADIALVDGTLLAGHTDVTLGAPAYVLSGAERDGRALSRALDDGRGWLRKDATGAELAKAIAAVMSGEPQEGGLGRLGVTTVVILCVIVLVLALYLVWLAVY